MTKYKLNYSELGSSKIQELSFSTAQKRASFIADKVIATSPKVFVLVVKHAEKDSQDDSMDSVYIFDWYSSISFIEKDNWRQYFLFEEESYEEAYKLALDLKETSPLCYS
jgi:hypothetical protein